MCEVRRRENEHKVSKKATLILMRYPTYFGDPQKVEKSRGIVIKITIWLFSFLPLLISIIVIRTPNYENMKPILKVETILKLEMST